jgi:hypothetical protein
VDGGGQETKTDPAVLGLGRRGTIFVLATNRFSRTGISLTNSTERPSSLTG